MSYQDSCEWIVKLGTLLGRVPHLVEGVAPPLRANSQTPPKSRPRSKS